MSVFWFIVGVFVAAATSFASFWFLGAGFGGFMAGIVGGCAMSLGLFWFLSGSFE